MHPTLASSRPLAGVEVRPRDFGGVDGMMYQDLQKKIPSFYVHFVNNLLAHPGALAPCLRRLSLAHFTL